ncbi:molybdate transport system substrate-binding protein [Rhizorhapis suberifaciens]|uniref:Molybdate transport system substrate-binding protein n=2 Tax=Rhizorhapis suberifaciens TaxID=13656 RepID=A0A840HWG0_9SPHN|nr:molybdate transport system substrate-binding protein [Rhizorhapis suberifaciens]
MIRNIFLLVGMLLAVASASPSQAREKPPLILAAASLQEALGSVAEAWAKKGNGKPVLSFAASSALAKQIGAGASADIFISADESWMDEVAGQGLIRPATRKSFLTNQLVLVAPAKSRLKMQIAKGFPLARLLGQGRLAMADPDAVPAGKYGKAALEDLGVWISAEPKIARAENVRAALAMVERGAAPLGIVYATDARASDRVRVVAVFPASSHPPISYSMAVLKTSSSRETEGFRRFLLSRQGRAIFARSGFISTGQ